MMKQGTTIGLPGCSPNTPSKQGEIQGALQNLDGEIQYLENLLSEITGEEMVQQEKPINQDLPLSAFLHQLPGILAVKAERIQTITRKIREALY